MEINTLDHVNLRTRQLDAMVAWYEGVLGLKSGPRPGFSFPGAWLYAGSSAFIHLVGVEDEDGAGSDGPLKLEHFAFRATGADEFERRLTKRKEHFEKSKLGNSGLVAFNIWDPDGNHIHVDFAPES